MDKNHWGDPEEFRPERFLDSKTGEIITDTWFLPFGIGILVFKIKISCVLSKYLTNDFIFLSGRRRCPGEILAKINMFMFIARLVQNYEMRIPDGVQLPDKPQEGVTICPSPFSVIFTPRQ